MEQTTPPPDPGSTGDSDEGLLVRRLSGAGLSDMGLVRGDGVLTGGICLELGLFLTPTFVLAPVSLSPFLMADDKR